MEQLVANEQQRQQLHQQEEQMVDSTTTDTAAETASVAALDAAKVSAMIDACFSGNVQVAQQLVSQQHRLYACQQDDATGRSPLMAAAALGNADLCRFLLEAGAPWNAVDRNGMCAGNYATDNQHWDVVNMLVDWGVRSELILGMLERGRRGGDGSTAGVQTTPSGSVALDGPVEHQPSTKPDYLRQRLHYTGDGKALLDSDQDAVMMEWERPLMRAHAQVLLEGPGRRVLNVGFGMGIIDSALQELQPVHHIIVEAHPDVYKRMLEEGWDKKPNVRVCFGRWQDVIPQLAREGVVVDAIFYDTYGEHYSDMEDFHRQMVDVLSKPHGVYSFFNGLAPDNIFFHGVACQCVKLQLSQLGLDSDFLQCEIQVRSICH